MGMRRILVLCATFFLVALSPRPETAWCISACGLCVYAALWGYDIFKEKRRR